MTEENKKTIWMKLASILGVEMSTPEPEVVAEAEVETPVEVEAEVEVEVEAEVDTNAEMLAENEALKSRVAELEAKLTETEELKTKLSEVEAKLSALEETPADSKVTLSATQPEPSKTEMFLASVRRGF